MGIELIPAVYWITQDAEADYSDALVELVRMFRPHAKWLLARFAPPDRSGFYPDALIYEALLELQHKILDQYLPPVEANRERSVACLWPWWDACGVKVLAGSGVETVAPLPQGNGGTHRLESIGWTYRFYRNDHMQQRCHWVRHLMKELARAEERALGKDTQLDIEQIEQESAQSGAPPQAGSTGRPRDLRDWLAITDPADREAALARGEGAVRKRAQRARERLKTALTIIELSITQPFARGYLKRLLMTEGRDRQALLNEFFRRHMRKPEGEE